jgi:hypothetical protein
MPTFRQRTLKLSNALKGAPFYRSPVYKPFTQTTKNALFVRKRPITDANLQKYTLMMSTPTDCTLIMPLLLRAAYRIVSVQDPGASRTPLINAPSSIELAIRNVAVWFMAPQFACDFVNSAKHHN